MNKDEMPTRAMVDDLVVFMVVSPSEGRWVETVRKDAVLALLAPKEPT